MSQAIPSPLELADLKCIPSSEPMENLHAPQPVLLHMACDSGLAGQHGTSPAWQRTECQ